MDGAWHVVLRDIMVILATAAVVSTSVFSALVAWQMYRLTLEIRDASLPIVGVVRETAETVQDAAGFMRQRTVPPVATAAGLGLAATRLAGHLTQFYRGLRGGDTHVTHLEG